jgi:hypothetical protein
VYNIQKAVSRLEFAPQLKEIEITDIKQGVGIFAPKQDKSVSFAALQNALKKAGYKLASAEIVVNGTLARDAVGWWLVSDSSNQRFALEGQDLERLVEGTKEGARLEITGDWKTVGVKTSSREVITPGAVKKISDKEDVKKSVGALRFVKTSGVSHARQRPGENEPFASALFESSLFTPTRLEALPVAPVRTTSPGLTVYRGGAFVPRLFFTRQHLGSLRVNRQTLQLSASYTPTPRVQLEAETSYSRTSFDDGTSRGASQGFGNIILRGKFRFYRAVERWGDRQASAQFGIELPTGAKGAPTNAALNAPAFVRQQLTPISGGLAAHMDLAYSQARGRFIFGGNVEGVMRSARAGFHTGHELRINTDAEYVVFPFKYRRPTKELFAILETNFVRRGRGRVGSAEVAESGATEFYLAPALQYVATTRLVVEASLQLPVSRDAGAQLLRTDRNILLGLRYLF